MGMQTDDDRFIRKLNDIARANHLRLPIPSAKETPSSDFLTDWARFLELCVQERIELSDPRWQRVNMDSSARHTRFTLEQGGEGNEDPDFRVGLQLLMGILDSDEPD